MAVCGMCRDPSRSPPRLQERCALPHELEPYRLQAVPLRQDCRLIEPGCSACCCSVALLICYAAHPRAAPPTQPSPHRPEPPTALELTSRTKPSIRRGRCGAVSRGITRRRSIPPGSTCHHRTFQRPQDQRTCPRGKCCLWRWCCLQDTRTPRGTDRCTPGSTSRTYCHTPQLCSRCYSSPTSILSLTQTDLRCSWDTPRSR